MFFYSLGSNNLYIQLAKKGSKSRFSAIMSNKLPNLDLMGGQSISYFYYDTNLDSGGLFANIDNGLSYEHFDNIRDFALSEFAKQYDFQITKEDIFYYIYGVLNSKVFVENFESSLRNVLPRIPFLKEFKVYSEVGKKLGLLHTNYEDCPYSKDIKIVYTGKKIKEELTSELIESINPEHCLVNKMRQTRDDKSTIVFNDYITITNIPEKAYEYVVNSKTPIQWIMTMYQVTVDKDSGIKDDPNLFSDDPRYILKLLLSVIELSVRTVDLIDSLPKELNYIDNHPDYSHIKE